MDKGVVDNKYCNPRHCNDSMPRMRIYGNTFAGSPRDAGWLDRPGPSARFAGRRDAPSAGEAMPIDPATDLEEKRRAALFTLEEDQDFFFLAKMFTKNNSLGRG